MIKKKVTFSLLFFLITFSLCACATKSSHIPETNSLTAEDCTGLWRKAPNEKEGFTEVYYFEETGTFNRYVRDTVSSGIWLLENNTITLKYENDSKPLKLTVEIVNPHETPGLLLDNELYLNVEKQHLFYQALNKKFENTGDFTGQWQRTNVIRACVASMVINDQTDSGFQFAIDAMWAAHSGSLLDTAHFIAPNQAFYFLSSEYSDDSGVFLFTLIGDELCVEYDGSSYALPFGANVTAHGTYTKDEPTYINENIVNETLPTKEIQERLCLLVGDAAYEQLIQVMEYGIQYTDEKFTYSGFINGIGVGVDFLIQDDGKIYCLGYWLDGPSYTFYTNDPEYKDKLPDWIEIWKDEYELSFVYKDV